jgi:large subunit ribosomal protein L17
MRHGDKIKNLSRTASHRRALLSNLAAQIIEHKRITTTLAKAKALRVYVEPLITRSKADSTHNRRMVFSYLQSKEAVTELFTVIGDKVANRPGGYTRIIKLAPRTGDAAEMAMIELVDFNEIYGKDAKDQAAKKTRRSRRSTAAPKKAATAPVAAEQEVVVAEAPQSQEANEAAAETAAADIAATETPAPEAIAPEAAPEEGTEEPKA